MIAPRCLTWHSVLVVVLVLTVQLVHGLAVGVHPIPKLVPLLFGGKALERSRCLLLEKMQKINFGGGGGGFGGVFVVYPSSVLFAQDYLPRCSEFKGV